MNNCVFCNENNQNGLVYSKELNLSAHLSCISNELQNPFIINGLAEKLAYLLELYDESEEN